MLSISIYYYSSIYYSIMVFPLVTYIKMVCFSAGTTAFKENLGKIKEKSQISRK